VSPTDKTKDDATETVTPVQLDVEKMIVFSLQGQSYALPIDSVQEIQQIVELAEVPTSVPSVVGMVNLRGLVIPAVDMRLLIGMPRADYALETPMIICHTRGVKIALIVDEVRDVVALPEGCLQPSSAIHSLADRMIGVCRMQSELVFLLDVDKLIDVGVLPGGGAL